MDGRGRRGAVRVLSRWIFLRHGQSTANRDGVFSGHQDVHLTPAGRLQAQAAGRSLAAESVSRVLVSDLSRARQTATHAMEAWSAVRGESPPTETVLHGLRERHLGEWQGRCRADMRATGENAPLLTWDGAAPGGESLAALSRRALTALAEQPDIAGTTLVVSHGGTMRAVLGLLDTQAPDQLATTVIANCVPVFRDVSPGRWAETLASLPAHRG
jgi:broad specificity phosphatase PhoE